MFFIRPSFLNFMLNWSPLCSCDSMLCNDDDDNDDDVLKLISLLSLPHFLTLSSWGISYHHGPLCWIAPPNWLALWTASCLSWYKPNSGWHLGLNNFSISHGWTQMLRSCVQMLHLRQPCWRLVVPTSANEATGHCGTSRNWAHWPFSPLACRMLEKVGQHSCRTVQ